MTTRDLRIGNYVGFKNRTDCYCEVVDLSYGGGIHIARTFNDGTEDDQPEMIEDITGLPLTEEWLKRLGFDQSDRHGHIFMLNDFLISGWNNKFATWYITYLNNEKASEIYSHIKHVHQLQQLYFIITGEELTIKNQ